ncbi:MAG: DUF3332 domain-containing protein [Prevotella sp.]|jgi:hypothetical protein|nr:DUF3332 domain-containing protein [Prevotella sp.]
MKKRFFSVTAIAFAGALLLNSCIGSFNLSRKVLAWNQTIDNKFVNEIVFIALWIVPVYEVSFLADIWVINTIEFWSGENPVEAGIVKKVQGENGVYTVETLDNGYNIKNEEGREMELVYDKTTNTWSAVANGESTKVLKFENEKNAIVYLPGGKEQKVELSNEGVLAFRQAVENAAFVAVK